MPHPDYNYRCSVAVACAGSGTGTVRGGPAGRRRSRDGAQLAHVEADARYWHARLPEERASFWEDEDRAPPEFRDTLLIAPARQEVLDALYQASVAVEAFSAEPDWGGGGVDFVFAGHGLPDGRLVVTDGAVSASEVIDAVLEPRQDSREKRRLALVLDCCHSGRTLAEVVVDKRQETDFLLIDGFAACMHDELSWELDLLGHGVLSCAMGAKPMGTDPAIDRMEEEVKLARAVREGDEKYLRGALHRHTPNPVTYLTEGDQTSVEVMNGWHIEAKGGGTVDLLGDLTLARVLDALERARTAELLSTVKL